MLCLIITSVSYQSEPNCLKTSSIHVWVCPHLTPPTSRLWPPTPTQATTLTPTQAMTLPTPKKCSPRFHCKWSKHNKMPRKKIPTKNIWQKTSKNVQNFLLQTWLGNGVKHPEMQKYIHMCKLDILMKNLKCFWKFPKYFFVQKWFGNGPQNPETQNNFTQSKINEEQTASREKRWRIGKKNNVQKFGRCSDSNYINISTQN